MEQTCASRPPDERRMARFQSAHDLLDWLRAQQCHVGFIEPTRLIITGPEDILIEALLRECRRHRTGLILLLAKRRPLGLPSVACTICASKRWWERPTGGWVCGICHPPPVRPRVAEEAGG